MIKFLEDFFSNIDLYYIEIIILLSSLTLGYFTSFIAKKLFPKVINSITICSQLKPGNIKICFTSRMVTVSILITYLVIAIIVAKSLNIDTQLITITIKIIFMIFVLQSLDSLIKNHKNSLLIIILLFIPLLLQLLDLLTPVIDAFDKVGFDVGKIHISAFFIFKTIYLTIILLWVGNQFSKLGEKSIRRQHEWSRNTREIIVKFFNTVLYTILVMVGMNILGVDITAFTVFTGAFGFGLALALQKIASNFFSGIILLFEETISVGDAIELQDGTTGKVKYLGARITIIEPGNGSEIVIPNEAIINSRVIHWSSKNDIIKYDIKFKLNIGISPSLVTKVAVEAASVHPSCLKDKDLPTCIISDVNKDEISYILSVWVKIQDKSSIKTEIISELLEKILR